MPITAFQELINWICNNYPELTLTQVIMVADIAICEKAINDLEAAKSNMDNIINCFKEINSLLVEHLDKSSHAFDSKQYHLVKPEHIGNLCKMRLALYKDHNYLDTHNIYQKIHEKDNLY